MNEQKCLKLEREACILTVNSIWGGWYHPPNREKIRKKKTAYAIKIIFYKCHQNPLGQLLKQFSKLYQLWGLVT